MSSDRGHAISRRQVLKWGGILAAGSLTSLVMACGGGSSTATTGLAASAAPATSAAPTTAATRAAGGSTVTAGPVSSATAGGATPSAARAVATGYQMRTNVQGNLLFWHFWGSPVRRNAIRRVIGEFNAVYPNIKVDETYVPFGDIFTRLLTTVAAGSGMPDALVDDRGQLRARAANKGLASKYVSRAW